MNRPRPSLLRMVVGALLALSLALLAAGCGSDERTATAPARTHTVDAQTMRLGARVFAEECATCHPLLDRPNADVHTDAPPLDLDHVQPTRAYANARVESGGVSMGGYGSVLSPRQKRAVVDYVLAVGGREVDVPADTGDPALAYGQVLYEKHCMTCHAIDGRKPTEPNAIWVATDFEDVRPSVAFIKQKVRDGQSEAMPPFRERLSADEIRAVARYVNAAAR